MQNICIIMPAYNEEKRIGRTLEAYSSFFEKLRKSKKISYELFIVINNTTDNTELIVKSYQKRNKNIKYIYLKRGGKGYAVTEGFKEALKKNFDLIGYVDADLATPPESFYDLVAKMDGYDGTLASRYLPNSRLYPEMSFRRLIVARVFNFVVRSLLFLPYKDTQCGAKLFRKEVIESIIPKLGMTQWAFDIELLYEAKSAGFRVKDIPTTWYEVDGTKLDMIRSPIQMLLAVLQLRISKSPIKRLLNPLAPLIVLIWKLTK